MKKLGKKVALVLNFIKLNKMFSLYDLIMEGTYE